MSFQSVDSGIKTASETSQESREAGLQGQGKSRSASAALDKLAGGTNGSAPPIDVGAVDSGTRFAKAASAALDALVPGPGSFANLTIGGHFPIYSAGAMTVFFEPSLMLQAARTDKGKLEATIELVLGLKAEAGASGDTWWSTLLAYLKAYVKGSMKIVGDDATEVFDQFMLTLRMAVDLACGTMEASPELRAAIVDGVMTPKKQEETVRGMDTEDGVTLAVGVGVEAGAETPLGNAKGNVDLEYATTIRNTDGNEKAEIGTRTSLTLKGELELRTLGMKTTPGLTLVFEGGKLSQWYFSLGGSKEVTLTKLNQLVLVGADWGQDLVNGISNMIAVAGKKEKSVAQAASLLSSIAVGPEALKYSVFGDSLRTAAAHPSFAGQSAMAVELCLAGQVGWSAAKGLEIKASMGTGTSWSLGTEGETPIFITAKSGDTIVSFNYDSVDRLSASS